MVTLISEKGSVVIYAKPLEDGSMAIGFFNRGNSVAKATLTWKSVGIRGEQTVRDLWRQKDVAKSDTEFVTDIASHGVRLVKLYPGNSREQATSGK